MKTCPHCHAQIDDDARFCLYCMTPLVCKQVVPPLPNRRKKLPFILLCVLLACAVPALALPRLLSSAAASGTAVPTYDTVTPTAVVTIRTDPSVGSSAPSLVPTKEPSDISETAKPASDTAVPVTATPEAPRPTVTPTPLVIDGGEITAKPTVTTANVPTQTPTPYVIDGGEIGPPTHVHTPVTDVGYAATCTSNGLTDGSHCSFCGQVLEKQEKIPKLGHTVVIIPAVSATCTHCGWTEGQTCSVCKAVLVAQTATPQLPHQLTPATYTSPATCTVCGYTEGTKLDAPPISITILDNLPKMSTVNPSMRINSATVTKKYNGDGTYKVTVSANVTNLGVGQVGGIGAMLSGTLSDDGTAAVMETGNTKQLYCYFNNVPGGTYSITF